MTWHLDQTVLQPYVHGLLGDVGADSVEAHLVACETCRLSVADGIDAERKERIWAQVRHVVQAPTTRRSERLLRRLGVAAAPARLLAMTPSVRPAWLLSVVVVLGTALFVSRSLQGGPVLLLLVAPLVPVAGVAASFGSRTDPVYELGLASPTGGFRLMLLRALAVVIVSTLVLAVPATVFVELRWSLACLLPALALTLLTLVLSTVTPTPVAAVCAGLLWVATLVVLALGPTVDAVRQASGQAALGVLVTVLAAGLFARRQSFERI